MSQWIARAAFAAALLFNVTSFAAKTPLSPTELREVSDVVVEGVIDDLAISTERSRYEPAFGNEDWLVYVTLQIEQFEIMNPEAAEGGPAVEQGSPLQVRCFRAKLRRSLTEWQTPEGNQPIPGRGSRVRAHLVISAGEWKVVDPNGFQPIDDQAIPLTDAAEIKQLRSRLFSLGLPLEVWWLTLWLLMAAMAVAMLAIRYTAERRKIRAQSKA